jgi:hypothetical protein
MLSQFATSSVAGRNLLWVLQSQKAVEYTPSIWSRHLAEPTKLSETNCINDVSYSEEAANIFVQETTKDGRLLPRGIMGRASQNNKNTPVFHRGLVVYYIFKKDNYTVLL